MTVLHDVPVGVEVLQKCCSLRQKRRTFYQASTLVLTFLAYTAYHMSRRPLAIVKNSLNKDCTREKPPDHLIITDENRHNWCDWAPFDGSNANRLLGILDSVYVFAYALCMFFSGMIAERFDLRYYLSLGMVISGIFTYLFGLAFYLEIHSYAYFVVVQILAGAVQCTGWPGVVACVGNWFGKKRRGLIFGIWNAHLYVGNILGAYVAGYFVADNWGLSFIVPAITVGAVGLLLFLFLVPSPEDVGCEESVHYDVTETVENDVKEPPSAATNGSSYTEKTRFAKISVPAVPSNIPNHKQKKAITFLDALKIPGVIEFSMCLFFSKLVSYTFLFWLPRYLDHTTRMGPQKAAYFSIAFDVGGILGGVIAGLTSDYTRSSAITCVGFLGLAIPVLFIFNVFGNAHIIINVMLQIICGSLVNGPYALITTAVSAELGTHPSIEKNSMALSTVTAIIDGMGSVGAAVGPLLAGVVSEVSWAHVFYMMMAADLCALIALLRPAVKEMKKICSGNSFFSTLLRNCKSGSGKRNSYQEI